MAQAESGVNNIAGLVPGAPGANFGIRVKFFGINRINTGLLQNRRKWPPEHGSQYCKNNYSFFKFIPEDIILLVQLIILLLAFIINSCPLLAD